MTTHADDRPTELTSEEVRQARPGYPVLKVLIASLILAAAAAFVLSAMFKF